MEVCSNVKNHQSKINSAKSVFLQKIYAGSQCAGVELMSNI